MIANSVTCRALRPFWRVRIGSTEDAGDLLVEPSVSLRSPCIIEGFRTAGRFPNVVTGQDLARSKQTNFPQLNAGVREQQSLF